MFLYVTLSFQRVFLHYEENRSVSVAWVTELLEEDVSLRSLPLQLQRATAEKSEFM